MYGAILGDIIGSPMEFDRGNKTKVFPLFSKESTYTDDSVMTVAVAEALMKAGKKASDDVIKFALITSMKKWGRRIPNAGYGCSFYGWIHSNNSEPYNSCGNGAAMRCSAAGWMYDSIEKTEKIAELTAAVTHNHPEGIKAAKATAGAIYLARTGETKETIRRYVEDCGYDLSRTLDEIRPDYYHIELAQKTVPEAVTAFLEGESYEDTIRNAVSLGGDTDTLGAISGAIAEAYYGIPEELKQECESRIRKDMRSVLYSFNIWCGR